jgi:hypothetical protein
MDPARISACSLGAVFLRRVLWRTVQRLRFVQGEPTRISRANLLETSMSKLLLAISLIASIAFGATQALAFNPQPDPPGAHDGE